MTYAQITNWTGVPFTNKGAKRTSVPLTVNQTQTPDKELLFEKQEMPSGNKLCLNPNWIKHYKVRLVDEENLKNEVSSSCWVVRDGLGGKEDYFRIARAETCGYRHESEESL